MEARKGLKILATVVGLSLGLSIAAYGAPIVELTEWDIWMPAENEVEVYFYVEDTIPIKGAQVYMDGVTVYAKTYDPPLDCSTGCWLLEAFTLAAPATCSMHTFQVEATNQNGETGSSPTVEHFPDYDPPAVIPYPSPELPDGLEGWYVSPVSLELEGVDPDPTWEPAGWCNSGVVAIEYEIWEGVTGDYMSGTIEGSSGALNFTEDGVYDVSFWAVDAAGNFSGGEWVPSPIGGGFAALFGLALQPPTEGPCEPPWIGESLAGYGGSLQVPSNYCYFQIDQTPPVITALGRSPEPNEYGWNNTPVEVSYSCSDNLSSWWDGLIDCNGELLDYWVEQPGEPIERSTTFDQEGQRMERLYAMDYAGNSAETYVEVNIDMTPPTVTIKSIDPPSPNEYGWYNVPVTVSFSCEDNLAGTGCPGPLTLSYNQTYVSLKGYAVDYAGNLASVGFPIDIKIDTHPPLIEGLATPEPNRFGWNNTDVQVSFECGSDGTWLPMFEWCPLRIPPDPGAACMGFTGSRPVQSEIIACEGDTLLTEEGSHLVEGLAADAAGNQASATITVNIDKTPPVITVTPPGGTFPDQDELIVSWQVSDALSGVASCSTNLGVSECVGEVTFTESGELSITAMDFADNLAVTSYIFILPSPIILGLEFEDGSVAIEVPVGEEFALVLALFEAPEGLQQLQLALGTDSDAVEFINAEPLIPLQNLEDFSWTRPNPRTLMISLSDSLRQVEPKARMIPLIRVELRAVQPGVAHISLGSFSATDDRGRGLPASLILLITPEVEVKVTG